MKIIIKIGTKAIFDDEKKKIRESVIKSISKEVSKLKKEGHEIMVVSSGAMGCGREIVKGNGDLRIKQAQAAAGQILLLEKYHKYFKKHKTNIAQFLLTRKELEEEESKNNLKKTYLALKDYAVPIINENDPISTEELTFGDNDQLAKKLMLFLDFDTLIILTEVGQLIRKGKKIQRTEFYETTDYDNLGIPEIGFGGLKSKLDCAKELTLRGKKVYIAKYSEKITGILKNKKKRTEFFIQ